MRGLIDGAPERCYRWLLSACRAWLLERAGGPIDVVALAPSDDLDWDTLDAMAHYQGVEPLLHALVSRSTWLASKLPRASMDRWERAYYGTLLRNDEVLQRLGSVLDRCGDADIPVVVLKGPAILAAVHGDVALRPMADVDLLCRLSDLPALRDLVGRAGFTRPGQPYLYQVDFTSPDDGLLLELHYDVHHHVGNRARFLETAWQSRTTASIGGRTFPVLSPEHQIVFELGHDAWHGFELDLRHIVDFAGRLTSPSSPVECDRLGELLATSGMRDEFAALVTALEHRLDLPLGVAPLVARAHPIGDTFEQQLFERSRAIGFTRTHHTAAEFRRRKGIFRKATFAWRRLVPPTPALQAAYGLRTPLASTLGVPIHLARTARDLYTRARAGY